MNLKPYPEYKDSGIPWLGQVPKNYAEYPGFALFTENNLKNVGLIENTVLSLSYGRIKIRPVEKLHGLVPSSFETYQIVKPGDIIIRSTDLQNDWTSLRIGLSNYDGIITSAYLCFRVSDIISSKFAYYLLHSFDLMKIFYGMGSGLRQNLSWTDFRRFPFFVPSLTVQAQIARILDWKTIEIAKFIKAKKRIIELLKEQKKIIINDAVTGKIDVTTGKPYPKYKDSGVEWLGQIPADWEVKKLKYITKSNVESLSNSTEPSYEFDYLEINKVKSGYIIGFPEKQVFETSPSRARRRVKYGDTIVSTVRTYLRSVLYINFEDCENLVVSTGFSVLTPFGNINKEFLGYCLRNDSFIDTVIRLSVGVSYPAIADTKLLRIKVLIPSINQQNEIIHFIKSKTATLDITISRIEKEISLMLEYRDRLIADVVTGKIDVRDILVPEVEIIEDINLDEDEIIDEESAETENNED